ncbi:unnamed protein product [Malus baccata var. baccata]
MSGPSDCRFDLNFGEEEAMPSQDNIWHPSFLSSTSPITVGDYVIKNDMTVAVVARNLLTLKDNRLLSKRSNELARFVGLFPRHLLPSSSEAVPRNEALNDQLSVPPPCGVLPSTEAPNNHPMVYSLSRALSTAETSPEQPL